MSLKIKPLYILILIFIAFCIVISTGFYAFHHYQKKLIMESVDVVLNTRINNLHLKRIELATHQTAQYIDEHMRTVQSFTDRFPLLKHAVEQVDDNVDGIYCELGVFSGTTINFIAGLIGDKTIHGFDSFEGLPETWRDGFVKGLFKMDSLPAVRDNVVLHKGWFDESLPVFKEQYPGDIVFMHMDADLYSSTKTTFDILGDQVIPGTVIVFDEFFNYPGWQYGEFKAFNEFVAEKNIEFEYLGYNRFHEQVAVKIISIQHD